MRFIWIFVAGAACALSALVAAVWVAASMPAVEPSALRTAAQALRADAAATRRMLSASCERDAQLERLSLELSAGGGTADVATIEGTLARTLGGKVTLYLAHGDKLQPLGAGPMRTLTGLRAAAEARTAEGEDDDELGLLDSCARRAPTGQTLWIARSVSVAALLRSADVAPEVIALAQGEAQANDVQTGERFALPLAGGRVLTLQARSEAARAPSWLWPAALCASGAFLLGVLLALYFVRRAPLEEAVLSTIEQAAERVAQGDLSSTIQLRVGGRADQTFRRFDRMTAELRETRAKLAEAERASAWQDMAQRVAHEIKNPLSPIKMALETLRKAHAKQLPMFDEIFAESTHAMLEEVQRMEHIVREFSDFARLPKARPGALDLAALTEEVAKLYAPSDVALGLTLEEGVPAHADREQLSQVIVNLLANAIDAARTASAPRVEVAVTREGERAVLRVHDNGKGVAEADRSRIFEPYVTGKEHGTGLGLAIVRRIVQDHAGTVTVRESPLGGAQLEVSLPQSASMP